MQQFARCDRINQAQLSTYSNPPSRAYNQFNHVSPKRGEKQTNAYRDGCFRCSSFVHFAKKTKKTRELAVPQSCGVSSVHRSAPPSVIFVASRRQSVIIRLLHSSAVQSYFSAGRHIHMRHSTKATHSHFTLRFTQFYTNRCVTLRVMFL